MNFRRIRKNRTCYLYVCSNLMRLIPIGGLSLLPWRLKIRVFASPGDLLPLISFDIHLLGSLNCVLPVALMELVPQAFGGPTGTFPSSGPDTAPIGNRLASSASET